MSRMFYKKPYDFLDDISKDVDGVYKWVNRLEGLHLRIERNMREIGLSLWIPIETKYVRDESAVNKRKSLR